MNTTNYIKNYDKFMRLDTTKNESSHHSYARIQTPADDAFNLISDDAFQIRVPTAPIKRTEGIRVYAKRKITFRHKGL